MNIEDIKKGLKCWDDYLPLNPPESTAEEALRDEIKRRAQTFRAQGIENVRYLLSIIEQYKTALEQAKDKTQVLASHCAYVKGIGYNLDAQDTFEKTQAIFEMLEQAIRK